MYECLFSETKGIVSSLKNETFCRQKSIFYLFKYSKYNF